MIIIIINLIVVVFIGFILLGMLQVEKTGIFCINSICGHKRRQM